jgi:DNA modification methylase
MSASEVLDGRRAWHVQQGDCRSLLRTLPDCSIDSCVTDAPYEIGFMSHVWDSTGIAHSVDLWREVLRVLKPGGHLLAFGGTRTSHRMVCAIEDAGLQVRDSIVWLYASGYPKSLNLGDGRGTALKPANEPICVARKPLIGTVAANVEAHGTGAINIDRCRVGPGYENPDAGKGAGRATANANGAAYGNGLGGVISPGHALGRWPANVVLSHADGCEALGTKRVRKGGSGLPITRGDTFGYGGGWKPGSTHPAYGNGDGTEDTEAWRCVPGCPVAALDAQSGERKSGIAVLRNGGGNRIFDGPSRGGPKPDAGYTDNGGASRFYFCAKTSTSEREAGCDSLPLVGAGDLVNREEGSAGAASPRAGAGRVSAGRRNTHSTVKPLELMRWLCRLVTPAGGVVLDPFSGSGTTGCAAVMESLRFVGFELEANHVAICNARIAYWEAERERRAEAAERERSRQVPLFTEGT